ncbi:platelet binding protein GspB-like isoform X3 [Gigantopelta aegis]|uniref:platelet binding protein GspB-like isoform X3 n=1 Tax=Gigantopelta aegis TaxID=1735272 RepID=UPI001B887BA8|nr:platelet binding protein GspB-like isoform X3 [Gigantopelta aegis]
MACKDCSVHHEPTTDAAPYIRMCSDLLQEISKLQKENKDLRWSVSCHRENTDDTDWQADCSEKRHATADDLGKGRVAESSHAGYSDTAGPTGRYSPAPTGRYSPCEECQRIETAKVEFDQQSCSSQNTPLWRKSAAILEQYQEGVNSDEGFRKSSRSHSADRDNRYTNISEGAWRYPRSHSADSRVTRHLSRSVTYADDPIPDSRFLANSSHEKARTVPISAPVTYADDLIPDGRCLANSSYQKARTVPTSAPVTYADEPIPDGRFLANSSYQKSRTVPTSASVTYADDPIPDGRFLANSSYQKSRTVATSASVTYADDPIPNGRFLANSSHQKARTVPTSASVTYADDPFPDGRILSNSSHQMSRSVPISTTSASPRQDLIQPIYSIDSERVCRSFSTNQDGSHPSGFHRGTLPSPSPKRMVFQSNITTVSATDLEGRESPIMSRTLSLKQSEGRPLYGESSSFTPGPAVVSSNSMENTELTWSSADGTNVCRKSWSTTVHSTNEIPKTGEVDDVIQSYRCIGEIAFQLERRILDYVFRRNDRHRSGLCHRRRFYGYTVSNIPSMISKEAEDAQGRFSPKRDAEIRNRLARIMVHLARLGYDMQKHGLVAQKVINKYGLLSRIPAKSAADACWINDEYSLRRLVTKLVVDERERSDVRILLQCLLLLAREDGKPIFLW